MNEISNIYNLVIQGINDGPLSNLTYNVIWSLFILDIALYIGILIKLYCFDKVIKNGENWKGILKEIINEYDDLIKDSNQEISTGVFIESYFSKLKIYKLPLIGTLKFIQNTVSVFILIGVLGTFIGIYSALVNFFQSGQEISVLLSDLNNLSPLFDGIGIAFATSIVGMSFSLLTTIILKIFNAEQYIIGIMTRLENYLENESNTDNQPFLARSFMEFKEIIKTGFKKNNQEINKLYNCMKGMENFSSQFEDAAVHMEGFNKDLEGSMKSLNNFFKMNEEFTNNFISNVKELNNNFVSNMQALNKNFDKLFTTMNEISEQQIKLGKFMDNINSVQDKNISILGNIKTDINKSQMEIKDQTEYMKEINNKQEVLFVSFREIDNNLIKNLGRIGSIYKQLEDNLFKYNSGIKGMEESISNLRNEQQEFVQYIANLKADNKEWINNLKNILDEENMNNQDRISSIYNLYESMSVKQGEISDGYRQLLKAVGSIQNSFDKDFKNNLKSLQDTLDHLKEQYDRGINNNVKNFADYVHVAKDVTEEKYNMINENFNYMKENLKAYMENVSFTAVNIEDALDRVSNTIKTMNQSIDSNINTFQSLISSIESLKESLNTKERE